MNQTDETCLHMANCETLNIA